MSGSPNQNDQRPPFRKRVFGLLRQFWLDVKDNMWKELTKNTARGILIVIGLLLGGYFVIDMLEEYKEQETSTKNYCFRGIVMDGYGEEPLPEVTVGIADVSSGTDLTNPDGKFVICADLPKDQKTVDITFTRAGYPVQTFYQEAVPQDRKSAEYYKIYVLRMDEVRSPETLN